MGNIHLHSRKARRAQNLMVINTVHSPIYTATFM